MLVVGAGQAGLSAGHHLRRTGLVPVGSAGWEKASGTFVVLDDNAAPGGAWQHRWDGLTMADAHHVHELPGLPLVVPDPAEPANRAVPYYFAQYEEAFGLNVQRPVRVVRVEAGPDDRLLVTTRHVEHPAESVVWAARGIVNASGTWQRPFWPAYPGRATFTGRQLHARDYAGADHLADGHVVVVGGGTSAVQVLLDLALVTTTTWVTRRPPLWVAGGDERRLAPEAGIAAVARVDGRTRAGLPPGSVVGATGLPLSPANRAGIEAGVLRARPVFSRITPTGVAWDTTDEPLPDGWVDGPDVVEARTILWATGYRAALDHLAPLALRGPGGGIVMDGTRVVADPRVQLVGYGPSASTVGANRAGREAVVNLRRTLGW
nr:NAD(P)-binding domain-containing protein [Cellulomonas sp. SLBN-39]